MMTGDQKEIIRHSGHEALWPKDLFERGIGWIIIARFKSGGERVEAGVFLVDVQCLGIKFAEYDMCHRHDYFKRIRGHYDSEFPMEAVEPSCARKLIEQAVEYAENLGFAPHRDFKKAARVFGGVRAEQCGQSFAFGRGGKPFYIQGPRETDEQARRIVLQLEKRCGQGNFDYLVALEDAADISQL